MSVPPALFTNEPDTSGRGICREITGRILEGERGGGGSERVDYVLAKLPKGRSAFGREPLAAAPAFRPMEYALHRLGDAYLQLQAFSLGLYAIFSSILIALREFSTANSPTSAPRAARLAVIVSGQECLVL